VLQACVSSWSLAAVLFLTLPAAVAGGALVAFAIGGSWTLGAVLGFIAVLGIAVRNGLGLIKHYQRLALVPAGASGVNVSRIRTNPRGVGEPASTEDIAIFAPGVVQSGTWDRFQPILMTAVITAIAVLPLAFMGDKAGSEFLRPMAIVILGGLVTATLYSLFAVPAMYLIFTPSRAKNPRIVTQILPSPRLPQDDNEPIQTGNQNHASHSFNCCITRYRELSARRL
jgi:Cu/Ag efflux pump CusA